MMGIGMGLLTACTSPEGRPPAGVASGRFVAYVDGAHADTLTGTATLRRSNGDVVALELNVDSTAGISVQLDPRDETRRTYTALDPTLLAMDRPGDPPGMVAFLETQWGTFQSTHGRLKLSYVAADAVGGTFTWDMEGTLTGIPANRSSVQVTGRVHAVGQ